MRDHERLVITGTFVAESAGRIGSSEQHGNVLSPARLFDGALYLPGTSIAGVLRRRCTELFGDHGAETLFGTDPGADELRVSPLVVSDATVAGTGPEPVEAVTRVALNRRTDSAGDKLLFEEQLVRAGTAFRFRAELTDPTPDTEATLAALLDSVLGEPIAVGAGTRNGRGRLRFTGLTVRRQRLTDPTTLRDWLTAVDRDTVGDPVDTGIWLRSGPHPDPVAAGPAIRIRVDLELLEPLLIGRTAPQGNLAEFQPLTTGELGVPGTAWRGALRARAERIHQTLRPDGTWWDPARARDTSGDDPDADDLPARLFGSTAHAGAIRVRDAALREPVTAEFSHVAIDRWTGAPADGRLFGTAPVVHGAVTLDVEAHTSEPALIGLLMLTVLDLAAGDLPVGSRRRRGMGSLAARHVELQHRGSIDGLPSTVRWEHLGAGDLTPTVGPPRRSEVVDALGRSARVFIEAWVEQFVKAVGS